MKKNIKYTVFVLVIAALTLLPILNTIRMINYGDNNLSNDYIATVLPITQALDGQLGFKDFVILSWVRAHFIPVWMAVTLIVAYFFHWNIYVEMYLGLVLMALRLWLIWDLFSKGRKRELQHLWMLPILSALIFSPTQSTTFTWGGIADAFGILSFFGTLGIWALVRYQGRFIGMWIAAISGIIASWTWGVGIVVWPLYFTVLLMLNYRKISYYLLWLGATCAAVFPYLYFTLKANFQDAATGNGFSYFNVPTLITLLGSPLVQYKFGMDSQLFYKAGIVGLFLLIIMGLMYLWVNKHQSLSLEQLVLPASLILWGIGGSWLISIGRSGIAPWYNTTTINFWMGLVILAFVFLFDDQSFVFSHSNQYLKYTFYVLPFSVLAVIFFIYFRYNVFSQQQPFYLPSRTPVSAACLRNYRTAPTYCEGTLFQWGVGYTGIIQRLAEPLEKHQLSVFSPHQIWTLQGEYVFDNVQINSFLPQEVSWWTGLDGKKSTWQDYRHLDLLLPSPAKISWDVDLSSVGDAKLKTAVGINANYSGVSDEDVTFIVKIKSDQKDFNIAGEKTISSKSRGWNFFQIDLKEYAGKKITIEFSTVGGENGADAWAMYQFPVIDVYKDDQLFFFDENVQYNPENTDLSQKFHAPSEDDVLLDGSDVNLWESVNLEEPRYGNAYQLLSPINMCMEHYSEILIEIAVAESIAQPRYVAAYLKMNSGEYQIDLPLLQDGNMHSYTYPVRMLELEPYAFLQDILIFYPNSSVEGEVQFGGVKLIRAAESTRADCSNYYPGAAILPETVAGEITPQNSINQTFVSECRGVMDGLDLYSATYARDNTPPLIVTLTDLLTGDVIWTRSILGEAIENNDWEIIRFDPIPDSYQRKYQINLQAPFGVLGDAVTIYQSQTDQYALGELRVADFLSVSGDLVFRYHCSSNK